MKNIIYILVIITLFMASACENLDREIINTLSVNQVETSYDYSLNRLTSIYTNLPEGFMNIDGAMMASASDEAEHSIESSSVHKFNTGAWNAYDNPDNVWGSYYNGIRKANLFLQNSNSIDLDAYRLDPTTSSQAVYTQKLADIKRWKYEARFLRAFFYFELVKRYGGIPLIKTPSSIDDAGLNVNRNSLAECVQFITDECDSAATNLPVTYTAADMGRVTKGAALSLKSRVLLFSASDLFNTTTWASGYAKPELISLAGDRTARWKAAADAAKAVIDLAGTGYALASNYRSLFNTYNNSEIILTRRNSASNGFEFSSFPIGFNLAQGGTTPSQNMVDAYEMTDGTTFDWSNPVHAANPYSNRDPRLGLSIIFNNSTYKLRTIECWTGGLDGKGIERATKTGYYMKKYVDENLNITLNNKSVHSWILIRLAEIYLNYAEALNEYSPGHADIKTYVDKVRARAGIAMPGMAVGTQDEVREKIRNERRVELAFENFRFWDLRRWMKAPAYLDVPLKGVIITKTGPSTFTYVPYDVETRTFDPKMYLYPIPYKEINIDNLLVQNPGW